MRTVRGVLAGTWFLLVAGSPTASAQQPADPLAAVLAQFPDNGLPALIADFERACQSPPAPHDPLVFQRLAQLGPAAHEALLGCALSSYGEDRGLASAFGDFDARAAWALPLLLEESNLTKPLTQELLVQLGPAAMPALPTLQALAQGQHKYLKTAIERIAKASDQPVPLAVARPQPHVDAQQIPALLERLRNGPEEQRWPALQALLLAGDAAAASAAEVILTLELDVRTLQTSQDLAAALRCTYGARCLQGRQPQEGLLESELPAELLRLSLAGRLDRLQSVQSWFQSTNAAVRRDLVLGLLLATNPQMHFGMLPTQDDEATVRQRIDLLQRVRRTRGARTVEELLPALVAAPSTAEREELLKDLRSLDLRDAPAALWPIVFECATKLPRAQQTASSLLYTIARQQAGLPDAVLRLLPQLGSGQDHAQLRRELLNATNAEAIVAYVRTVSERPDDLAVWLTILNAANRERGSQIVALLGSSLAAEIALLPATGKLAWLELDRSADVDDAIWQELLTDPDPASRLKAIRAARWRDRTHPLPLDLLLICLRDEDLSVATITSYMVGADQRDPQRVTRAIAARFDTASDDLRSTCCSLCANSASNSPRFARSSTVPSQTLPGGSSCLRRCCCSTSNPSTAPRSQHWFACRRTATRRLVSRPCARWRTRRPSRPAASTGPSSASRIPTIRCRRPPYGCSVQFQRPRNVRCPCCVNCARGGPTTWRARLPPMPSKRWSAPRPPLPTSADRGLHPGPAPRLVFGRCAESCHCPLC